MLDKVDKFAFGLDDEHIGCEGQIEFVMEISPLFAVFQISLQLIHNIDSRCHVLLQNGRILIIFIRFVFLAYNHGLRTAVEEK